MSSSFRILFLLCLLALVGLVILNILVFHNFLQEPVQDLQAYSNSNGTEKWLPFTRQNHLHQVNQTESLVDLPSSKKETPSSLNTSSISSSYQESHSTRHKIRSDLKRRKRLVETGNDVTPSNDNETSTLKNHEENFYHWKFNLNITRYENNTEPSVPYRSENRYNNATDKKYLGMAVYVEGSGPQNNDLQNAWTSVGGFLRNLFGSDVEQDLKEKVAALEEPATSQESSSDATARSGRSSRFIFNFWGFGGGNNARSNDTEKNVPSEDLHQENFTSAQVLETTDAAADVQTKILEGQNTTVPSREFDFVRTSTIDKSQDFDATIATETVAPQLPDIHIGTDAATELQSTSENNLMSTPPPSNTEFRNLPIIVDGELNEIATNQGTTLKPTEDSQMTSRAKLEEYCMNLYQRLQKSPRFVDGFFDFFGSGDSSRGSDSGDSESGEPNSSVLEKLLSLFPIHQNPKDSSEVESKEVVEDRGARFLGLDRWFPSVFGSGNVARQVDLDAAQNVLFDDPASFSDGPSMEDCQIIIRDRLRNQLQFAKPNLLDILNDPDLTLQDFANDPNQTEFTESPKIKQKEMAFLTKLLKDTMEMGTHQSPVQKPFTIETSTDEMKAASHPPKQRPSTEPDLKAGICSSDEWLDVPSSTEIPQKSTIQNRDERRIWNFMGLGSGFRDSVSEDVENAQKEAFTTTTEVKKGGFFDGWFGFGSGRSLDVTLDDELVAVGDGQVRDSFVGNGDAGDVDCANGMSQNDGLIKTTSVNIEADREIDGRKFLGSLSDFGSGRGDLTETETATHPSAPSFADEERLFENTDTPAEVTTAPSVDGERRFIWGLFGSGERSLQDEVSDGQDGRFLGNIFGFFGSGESRAFEEPTDPEGMSFNSDPMQNATLDPALNDGCDDCSYHFPTSNETLPVFDCQDDCDFNFRNFPIKSELPMPVSTDRNIQTRTDLITEARQPTSTNIPLPTADSRIFGETFFMNSGGGGISIMQELEATTFVPTPFPTRIARLNDGSLLKGDSHSENILEESTSSVRFFEADFFTEDSLSVFSMKTFAEDQNLVSEKAATESNKLPKFNIETVTPELVANVDSFQLTLPLSVATFSPFDSFSSDIRNLNNLATSSIEWQVFDSTVTELSTNVRSQDSTVTEIITNARSQTTIFTEPSTNARSQDSTVTKPRTNDRSQGTTVTEPSTNARSQDSTVTEPSTKDRSQDTTVTPSNTNARSQDATITHPSPYDRSQETTVHPQSTNARSQDSMNETVSTEMVLTTADSVATEVFDATMNIASTETIITRVYPPIETKSTPSVTLTKNERYVTPSTRYNATDFDHVSKKGFSTDSGISTTDLGSTSGRPGTEAYPPGEGRPIRFCNGARDCDSALNERCVTKGFSSVCDCGRGYVRHPVNRRCDDKIVVETSLRFPEEKYDRRLRDPQSDAYKRAVHKARDTMTLLLGEHPALLAKVAEVRVSGFAEGSLVVRWSLVVAAEDNETTAEVVREVDARLREAFRSEQLAGKTPFKVKNVVLLSISNALNPCQSPELNYCSRFAICHPDTSRPAGFRCECQPGFPDTSEHQDTHPGEVCQAICPKDFCGKNGVCRLENDGSLECLCNGWYFGSQCHISGIVVIASFLSLNVFIIVMIVIIICISKCQRRRRKRCYGENDGHRQRHGSFDDRLTDVIAMGDTGQSKSFRFLPMQTPEPSPIAFQPQVPDITFTPASSTTDGSYYDSTFDTTPSYSSRQVSIEIQETEKSPKC